MTTMISNIFLSKSDVNNGYNNCNKYLIIINISLTPKTVIKNTKIALKNLRRKSISRVGNKGQITTEKSFSVLFSSIHSFSVPFNQFQCHFLFCLFYDIYEAIMDSSLTI